MLLVDAAYLEILTESLHVYVFVVVASIDILLELLVMLDFSLFRRLIIFFQDIFVWNLFVPLLLHARKSTHFGLTS